MAVYSDHWRLRLCQRPCPTVHDWNVQQADLANRKSVAAHLVDRGARLRDVAAVMNIPMALRRIKPAVAHWATNAICQHPEVLNFMPDATPRQRIWLRSIGRSSGSTAILALGRQDMFRKSRGADIRKLVHSSATSRIGRVRKGQAGIS